MKVLITTPWVARYVDNFRADFPQVEFLTGESEVDLVAAAGDAEIVFGPVSSPVLRAAESLRWIQSGSAGVEWMRNTPELAGTDITVTNTRGAHATTIAEHAFGMLFFLTRGFDALYEAQKAHDWQRPLKKPGVGVVGMTMGIIGLGNLGRAIAERAVAFKMRVIAVDAHEIPQPDYVSELRLLDGLDDLLSRCDVVVVTTPITPETRDMLGPDKLRLMQPSAYLLVMSRGGIIDEPALVEMLREGKLAGAGLDVAAIEPLPPESDLWDAPNVIITPHSSPTSSQTHGNVAAIMADNLKRYLAGEPLTNSVDKKLGY